MPETDEQLVASVCEGCGASFVCGAAAGMAGCWCMEQAPTAIEPTIGGNCYCPKCLAQRLSARPG